MLGILDVGSNTVHLLVLDPAPHARPAPLAQERRIVPLMLHLDQSGGITAEGMGMLTAAVTDCVNLAREWGVTELVGMATSALHEIPHGRDAVRHVEDLAGIPLRVLTGAEEAEFTFIAARRWAGWGAGRLLVCDIGGGSLQLAQGASELPAQAFSLPLGAGLLTHQFLPSDPGGREECETLVQHVRATLAHVISPLTSSAPDRVLGTSKMLRSLGRLAGFRRTHTMEGRILRRDHLEDWTERLGRMPLDARLQLPGMTPERARQVFAGAVVASETMRALNIDELETCPWALREGVLLQFIDPRNNFDSSE
ncbi:Ppx/GppA family phosphatase [Aestuariimicrobium sp. p3-SID1156]|uniref:Ppx/GppA phosphatase family protein n=1 Tax=Aestuariimicrobium sp. p3-SID1156 TaxID=2916038 RepID=UPI00223B54EB|nr:Ppx/GppA family phosphatase [Aestuariimicrobium sp. p3-SID1156]MCT1458174.1 Ppx/GppA family phosphatase [Aestuariimicrobium sp. p3-SID1156]